MTTQPLAATPGRPEPTEADDQSTAKRAAIDEQFRTIRALPGVTGLLLATFDGRLVASDLDHQAAGAAAAMTASAFALAGRLGDLTGDDPNVQELQVRTNHGYVCLHIVDGEALLGIIASDAANLALLRIEVRNAIRPLADALA